MNERDMRGIMNDQDLVNELREHAEWAEGNQYETPITLCDDLAEAADRLENQNAHIAALQKEIERLRGQNKQLREAAALVAKESAELLERRWIPVDERLPEDPVQKVLIFVPHTHGNIVDVGRYLGADGWVLEGWYLTQNAVTHWMPLPTDPEVENA